MVNFQKRFEDYKVINSTVCLGDAAKIFEDLGADYVALSPEEDFLGEKRYTYISLKPLLEGREAEFKSEIKRRRVFLHEELLSHAGLKEGDEARVVKYPDRLEIKVEIWRAKQHMDFIERSSKRYIKQQAPVF